MLQKLLWPLLALALVSGCNPIKSDLRANDLRKALWGLENVMRWGELANAWSFQNDALQRSNPPPGNLDDIRVSGYEQLGQAVEVGEDRVRVVVRITYIRQRSQTVHTLLDEQIWQYDTDLGGWRRANPMPGFGLQ